MSCLCRPYRTIGLDRYFIPRVETRGYYEAVPAGTLTLASLEDGVWICCLISAFRYLDLLFDALRTLLFNGIKLDHEREETSLLALSD